MPRLTLLLAHGWGYDPGFWEPLARHFADLPWLATDRGYFGAPAAPVAGGPVVAIGHSLGALLLLRDPPPQCRALIAINGFDRFVEGPGVAGVPARPLDRMLARLRADPARVLADFRARCGDPAPFPVPDPAPLERDLRLLRDADARAIAAGWSAPILSLHGDADPLLPAPMRRQAFASAPDVTHATLPGGHLLPRTDPAGCATRIRALIDALA